MTGASGAIYAIRFLEQAARAYRQVYVMASDQALQVVSTEMDRPITRETVSAETLLGARHDNLVFLDRRDYFSPPASGSFRHDGMVVVPCSMGTAGRIAHGVSDDLVTRAADVCLKERRPLILVVRDTPLNLIQLRNMTQLAEAGATILPASPGFYFKPQTIEQLADFIVARILQQLGVHQISEEGMPQWQFTDPE